jgi:plasmid segregation protein ParM
MTIYPQIVEYDRVLTVDIGGFTLDYLLMRGGRPDLSVCDSLEKGVIRLYNEVISRINSEQDILLEEQDVDRIIQGKRTDYSREVTEVVESMTKTYVEDILGTLRERGLDLKTGCVVWIGGGAKLLRDYLENSKRIGRSVFVEDICANAKGYGILYQLQKRGR